MSAKTMKMIRNILIAFTIVVGFLMWLALPNEIKNTPAFHLGTGASTSKYFGLPFLLLPFFSLLPKSMDKDVHTEDEEERKKIIETRKIEEGRYQVGIAFALMLVVIGVMGLGLLLQN